MTQDDAQSSSRLRVGTYRGPIPALQGESALLLPGEDPSRGTIRAQFHRAGLVCPDRFDFNPFTNGSRSRPQGIDYRAAGSGPGLYVDVSLGWHEFSALDFVDDDDPVKEVAL